MPAPVQIRAHHVNASAAAVQRQQAGSSAGSTVAPGLPLPGTQARQLVQGQTEGEPAAVLQAAPEEAGETARHKRRDAAAIKAVGWWKAGGGLTHVVLADAGHMTPHDAPLATRYMLERWLGESVQRTNVMSGGGGSRGDGVNASLCVPMCLP